MQLLPQGSCPPSLALSDARDCACVRTSRLPCAQRLCFPLGSHHALERGVGSRVRIWIQAPYVSSQWPWDSLTPGCRSSQKSLTALMAFGFSGAGLWFCLSPRALCAFSLSLPPFPVARVIAGAQCQRCEPTTSVGHLSPFFGLFFALCYIVQREIEKRGADRKGVRETPAVKHNPCR